MRLRDGHYECANCGALLEGVPAGQAPHVERIAASGRPTVRVLRYRGREIHRCEIEDQHRRTG